MTPMAMLRTVVPVAELALPKAMRTDQARCLLLAIAGQESGWNTRLQEPSGIARGFWQCEKLGAVLEVMTSSTTADTAKAVCSAFCIEPGLDVVYQAIAYHDPLAYCIARLALWAVPHPLPAIGDEAGAWQYYHDTWRPGSPRPDSWPLCYGASELLFAEPAAPSPPAA